MRVLPPAAALSLLSLSLFTSRAPAQVKGTICGEVLDERGAPAAGVHLIADYLGGHSGPMDGAVTDANGRYCVREVSVGQYQMSANDKARGYPDVGSLFYSAALRGPRVNVSVSAPNPVAKWQIPYKAGVLKINLSNVLTGKPIPTIFYELSVRSAPTTRWLRGSSSSLETLLLPPNEDVILRVSSTGYEQWPGDGTSGRVVHLREGELQTLAVALRPQQQQ